MEKPGCQAAADGWTVNSAVRPLPVRPSAAPQLPLKIASRHAEHTRHGSPLRNRGPERLMSSPLELPDPPRPEDRSGYSPRPDLTPERTATDPSTIARLLAGAGFCGPFPFLSAGDCRTLIEQEDEEAVPPPLDWRKGRATTDRRLYEVATAPWLLDVLGELLGESVVLWGASFPRRRPGSIHRWHTDSETAAPTGRFASVWIGLEHTSRQTGLSFVRGSHLFGKPLQRVIFDNRLSPVLADNKVETLARRFDARAIIETPDALDGEAIIFDGRVWHSSRNEEREVTRTALLLQYAAANESLAIPDVNGYDWPFRFVGVPRLPAILISGSRSAGDVRLLPPPPPIGPRSIPMITTAMRSFALPFEEDPDRRLASYSQFRGPTRSVARMSCHISVLSPGHVPHPPHTHHEEELLMVLRGEAEIVLADSPDDRRARTVRMEPGALIYYPSGQYHTITNPGTTPISYLMFKWSAGGSGVANPLPTSVFKYDPPTDFTTGRAKEIVFEGPTHQLGKLHVHVTSLEPGVGYEPHVDSYDVAILLLSGEIETLGSRLSSSGVVYYSAGEAHGMRSVGTTPATYIVIEFHRPGRAVEPREE